MEPIDWTHGIWIIQDHDPSKGLDERHCMGGVRLHERTGDEQPQSGGAPGKPYTYGDFQGGMLWLSKEERRAKLHSWFFTPPAVAFKNPPNVGTSQTPQGVSGIGAYQGGSTQVRGVTPPSSGDDSGWFPVRQSGDVSNLGGLFFDDRYEPRKFQGADEAGGRGGYPAWVPKSFTFPTTWTGQISRGTDERAQWDNLHPDFWGLVAPSAGPDTSTRVYDTDKDGYPVRCARLRDLVGVVDSRGSGSSEVDIALNLDTFWNNGLGLVFQNGNGLGMADASRGGPFFIPALNDRHAGAFRMPDGRSIQPLHMNAGLLWHGIEPDGRVWVDGPFDRRQYDLDGYERHVNIVGGDSLGYRVFVPYFQDGEADRDITIVRGNPTSAGGGGGGRPPGGGPPGGGGPGGPGSRRGGKNGSGEGLGGGDDAASNRYRVLTDDIIGLSPVGAGGAGKNLLGRPGGPVAAGAAQAILIERAGQGLPVVGANRKPKNLNLPQTLATTGIAIKATSTRNGEFDPTSSGAGMSKAQATLYESAPLVAQLVGWAKGDGSWQGFEKYSENTPTTQPKGAGGAIFAPPCTNTAQLINGTYTITNPTSLAFPPGVSSIALAMPDKRYDQVPGYHFSGTTDNGVELRRKDTSGNKTAGFDMSSGGSITMRDTAGANRGGIVVGTGAGRFRSYGQTGSSAASDPPPSGYMDFFLDTTTGHASRVNSSGTVVDLEAGGGLPTRYVSGLVIRYASASTVTVSAGKARDKADGADMTLSSQVTVSTTTVNAALGYERKTLTGTATWTLASANVAGSGTAFLTEFGTRALSAGTIGTGGAASTTITGTGTLFLSDVAVDDLIGNATVGYSRVTAIASDTSLTVTSNLTISNGSTGLVIENPHIESAGGKRHPLNAIASNTALTISNVALSTETGVACYATAGVRSPVESGWRAVWLLSGGSGTTVALSTQRTTPYLSISGYTTSYRRIGWVRLNASGNIIPTYGSDGSFGARWNRYETDVASTGAQCRALANASSTTSWQSFGCDLTVPPTARAIQGLLFSLSPNTAVAVQIRGRGLGDSAVGRQRLALAPSTSGFNSLLVDVPCDGAQYLDHGCQAGGPTGDGSYFDVLAYEDVLE